MAPKGKGKQSKGGGSSIDPKIIVAGLAILGIGYFISKSKTKKMAAEAPAEQVAAPAPGNTIQTLPDDAPVVDAKAYQAELDSKRAKLAAAQILGLKSLELKEEGGLFQVPFSFVPKKVWCQGGDLDTMKYASRDPGAQQILITLEPVAGGGKGDSVHTSVGQLYKGFDYVFKLKPSDSTQSYALYICSDTKKAESCKGKTLVTHDAMSDELADPANKNNKKDYIFYFQHMVLDKNVIETYRTNDFTDEFKGQVGGYLKAQKNVGSSDFNAAWKTSEVTRSAPADVAEGKIVLSLPYNDPRCLGGLPEGRPDKKK